MGLTFSFGPVLSNTSGYLYLYGLNSASTVQSNGTTTYGPNPLNTAFLGGSLIGTTNVNAFQVIIAGSSINTGTFKFYGLN